MHLLRVLSYTTPNLPVGQATSFWQQHEGLIIVSAILALGGIALWKTTIGKIILVAAATCIITLIVMKTQPGH